MRRRGNINIIIANYLDNNFEFMSDITDININNKELRHIIISRWYYGVYLIAKDYLINNFICTDDKSNFHHKTNEDAHIYSIWHRIGNVQNGIFHSDLIQGEQLAKLREDYEYTGNLCNDTDFNNAKRIFNEIYEILNRF
ncbi:hypothetical protein [Brachyspira pilosicoli]|uniref:hypothetical protein n=1 Tax=Brachyspira pilosicoli TaxID=52584 RepID=UPI001CA5BB98|nr:hypothetical protein [Brachyspira pilosicoli]MBW5381893.1 hypothetical protein [Brachyspira pilosicoli]